MKHIKKIADYSMVGGMGAILMNGLTGCESPDHGIPQQTQSQNDSFQQASQKQGAFVVIQETGPKQYQIVDEYPSSETRVILKGMDGSERILSQEELDAMVKEEAAKIDAGTSNLTSDQQVSSGMGGLGLGETIMASMAGAILGSWIGSKLFNNQNYQNKRQASYKSPQTYNRSKNSFNKAKTAGASKKSGYFGNNKQSTTNSKRSTGSFGKKSGSRSFGG
ncbi:MAG: UPF0323 family lipoprotein [Epsilonproteobacteria bacterium]|nr:UPF0323 family lipoprotein [Campylobacterota bacterium]